MNKMKTDETTYYHIDYKIGLRSTEQEEKECSKRIRWR
jgi:hypothetical protein